MREKTYLRVRQNREWAEWGEDRRKARHSGSGDSMMEDQDPQDRRDANNHGRPSVSRAFLMMGPDRKTMRKKMGVAGAVVPVRLMEEAVADQDKDEGRTLGRTEAVGHASSVRYPRPDPSWLH